MSYEGSVCNMEFDRKYNLNRHMKTKHEENKQFVCPLCSFSFTRADILTKHLSRKHDDSPKLEYNDQLQMENWWERESLLPFTSPATILISGATQNGKSYLTK